MLIKIEGAHVFHVSIFGGFEHLRNFKAPVARRCWAEVGGGRIQKPRGGLHKVRHMGLYADPNRLSQKRDRRTLALLGCHNVNATRYLGYPFAVTFRAPYLRCLVLCDGFGALK